MADEAVGIWADEWDSTGNAWNDRVHTRRMARGNILGATLHQLPPHSDGGPLHFHHGNEEMLIVLRGRPTLRTPQGERQLEEGEIVVFPVGPQDAHKCRNETDQPVRYLFVSNRASPDAVEYPDTGWLSVMALTNSQHGRPLWDMRTLEKPEPRE
jgi:uncharacterized cupin superfamily protein